MRNQQQDCEAFTLVEIMIVVAIIGLLAALCIANYIRAQTTSQTNTCIDNLRLIDAAEQQWALEMGKEATSVPAATDLQPYLGHGTGDLPWCPADTTKSFSTSYTINNCSTPPLCNIVPTLHILH